MTFIIFLLIWLFLLFFFWKILIYTTERRKDHIIYPKHEYSFWLKPPYKHQS